MVLILKIQISIQLKSQCVHAYDILSCFYICNMYVDTLTTSIMVFGTGFVEVIRVKIESWERGLHDGFSGLTRIGWEISVFPSECVLREVREHTVKRRPSVGVRKKALSQNWTMHAPDLRLPAYKFLRIYFCCIKPVVFYYGSPNWLRIVMKLNFWLFPSSQSEGGVVLGGLTSDLQDCLILIPCM